MSFWRFVCTEPFYGTIIILAGLGFAIRLIEMVINFVERRL